MDACVSDMVKRCAPFQNVKKMRMNLHQHDLFSVDKFTELLRLVTAHVSCIIDVDPLLTPSVQRLVLSHSELETLQTNLANMKASLKTSEQRMQC